MVAGEICCEMEHYRPTQIMNWFKMKTFEGRLGSLIVSQDKIPSSVLGNIWPTRVEEVAEEREK